jgi:hypothetical protein
MFHPSDLDEAKWMYEKLREPTMPFPIPNRYAFSFAICDKRTVMDCDMQLD